MSTLTHGGRIVPILTSHEQHHRELDSSSSPSRFLDSQLLQQDTENSLLDQQLNHEMTRRGKKADHASLEMSCLKERGLVAIPTEGDGNCLYYSLSDQLFGNFNHGDEIRHKLADHMAANKSYFMQFVVAEGGERRRPRRAAVSAYATRSVNSSAPSVEDKEQRFADMVASTRKNGEWGSSEHLQAFCQVYRVDINVYTVSGVQAFRDVNAPSDEHRDVIHVAFHDFKHYSSVRPVNGTHKGLMTVKSDQAAAQPCSQQEDSKPSTPNLADVACSDSKGAASDEKEVPTSPKASPSPEPADLARSDIKEAASDDKEVPPPRKTSPAHELEDGQSTIAAIPTDSSSSFESQPTSPDLAVDVFPPWDIQSIQDGLGGRYDRETIIDMLQKCRGDIDRAFAALLGEKESDPERVSFPGPNFKPCLQASRESSPVSTGSKRSADDSEDSEDHASTVRQGRTKKRMVSNLTLGVGISFRDEQNEVLSLNLHVNGDKDKAKAKKMKGTPLRESTVSGLPQEQPEQPEQPRQPNPKGLRRSGRKSKARLA
ncbi:OTU-like cysteine protease family protein [Penicillium ucsense]|uniref:OTU-like cysteine protease family protein n=1 Tax=Penicillium ucsense TaxID=2839758 RepID=A0A8J8WDI0_9EURO|nr:OTU-like cysteine protease family protein [Penicillium ucsense]KAF7730329.1 OTU-like cysteine protease family protein [Penicillium ucsense]